MCAHEFTVFCRCGSSAASSPTSRSKDTRRAYVFFVRVITPRITVFVQVNCVDYYHGGDKPYLISGADDHTIKIWDTQNKT